MSVATQPERSNMWWGLAALCGVLVALQLLFVAKLLMGSDSAASQAEIEIQRFWLAKEDALSPEQANAIQDAALNAEPPAARLPHTNADDPPTSQATTSASPSSKSADLLAEFAVDEQTAKAAADQAAANGTPSGLVTTESFIANEDELRDIIPAEPRTTASLTAPEDALLEASEHGALPMRHDDRTPFEVYARPFSPPAEEQPLVGLLVTGLGAIRTQTETAIDLPRNVTLAFNPYARHTPAWLQSARNKGFESWLILPAQPDSFPAGDNGPNALLVEQEQVESLMRLKRTMGKAAGYSGLVLPTAEIYSDHLDSLGWLKSQISSRGLALIAAEKPKNSAAQGWFKKESRALQGDVLIDETLNMEQMVEQFKRLETIARQNGAALGVIRPYPLSIKLAGQWIESLQSNGFVLAPASALFAAGQ